MIELVRRRMMMGAKPYDAEVEWVGLNGRGLIMKQTPSQYTVWFKIMVITRDNSLKYPSYISGSGPWTGVAGVDRWLFYYDNVYEKQWLIESRYYSKYYTDSTIINNVYEPPYALYVESKNATIIIG